MSTEPKRYRKIVVPLDGSKPSELAIPHAADIARVYGATLTLLHVFRPPAHEYTDLLTLASQEDQLDAVRDQVQQYLEGLCQMLGAEGITAQVHMCEGLGVAGLILDYVNSGHADLVVMTTRGRTGLARFVFGSVAHKVTQGARVPVMLVYPDDHAEPPRATS